MVGCLCILQDVEAIGESLGVLMKLETREVWRSADSHHQWRLQSVLNRLAYRPRTHLHRLDRWYLKATSAQSVPFVQPVEPTPHINDAGMPAARPPELVVLQSCPWGELRPSSA